MTLNLSILQSAKSRSQVCGPTASRNLPRRTGILVAYCSNFWHFSNTLLKEEIICQMETKDCQKDATVNVILVEKVMLGRYSSFHPLPCLKQLFLLMLFNIGLMGKMFT